MPLRPQGSPAASDNESVAPPRSETKSQHKHHRREHRHRRHRHREEGAPSHSEAVNTAAPPASASKESLMERLRRYSQSPMYVAAFVAVVSVAVMLWFQPSIVMTEGNRFNWTRVLGAGAAAGAGVVVWGMVDASRSTAAAVATPTALATIPGV
jgi:cation transport ATPase